MMKERPGAAFGDQLRALRTRAGLTQEQVAERSGLSVRGLSDLERGLKARPQFETVRLLAEALGLEEAARDALLTAARPVVPSGPAPPQLPVPPTPFVGREQEVAMLTGLLRDPGIRLVTLTGPGGTGKTRLALQAATELATAFPDGVWFVDLSSLGDPALVSSTIASVLMVREERGRPLLAHLADVLAPRRLLLVLDNLEHLLPGAAGGIGELLETAPQLTVLATSRAPLRVRAEREVAVPPLALPRRQPPPTVVQLSQYAAVRLFIDRAQAVKIDFTVDHDNAAAVAELCHRLDGLPLAIELAAARVRLFGPEAMLERLAQRLPLLTGGARDLPERQQTLTAAIAWSYDLLTEDEQKLFRRLSVFAGGWTLTAAEAVAGSPASGELDLDVLAGLERLVEHSLVRVDAGTGSEVRFGMLETIRAYALGHLEQHGEAAEAQERHTGFFVQLAEAAEPQLWGSDQLAWLARLEREHDNLRAALGWSLARYPETALRLSAALWQFWGFGGHLSEGRAWLERTLASTGAAPSIPRVRVLNALGSALGSLTGTQGDRTQGIALLREGLEQARTLGDRQGENAMLLALGTIAARDARYVEAEPLFEASLLLSHELGDRVGEALTLNNLGYLAYHQGNLTRAETLLAEALMLSREVGAPAATITILDSRGAVAQAQGDLRRAVGCFREGLGLARDLGDWFSLTGALNALGGVAVARRRSELAARWWGAAAAYCQSIGATNWDEARFASLLSAARAQLGEAAFAAAYEAGQALSVEEAMVDALTLVDALALDPPGASV